MDHAMLWRHARNCHDYVPIEENSLAMELLGNDMLVGKGVVMVVSRNDIPIERSFVRGVARIDIPC